MANETTVVETTTKFGLDQVSQPTPEWAKWMFRIFFYASSFTSFIMTIDASIPAATVISVVKYLSIATMAVHGFSKLFGVDVTVYEEETKDVFKSGNS